MIKNKHVSLQLRQAKAEIKKIMDQYNLGGLVTLHDKSHTEFEFFLPTWSVAQFEEQPNGDMKLRIKHKKEDDPEVLLATCHVLFDCAQVCDQMAKMMEQIRAMLKDSLEITNAPFNERD